MNSRTSVLLSSLLLSLLSCYSLDSFLFQPLKVQDSYLKPADMDTSWHVRFVIPESLYQEVELTSLGKKIYGYYVKPDGTPEHSQENQVTILYCHGSGANINRYWGRVERLWEMGYRIFIFDYQGYGKSEGTCSGAACYADGEAALTYCLARSDIDTSKIVYYGWSLGSFVATHLSSDIRHPPALILETPPASASALAKEGAVLNIPGSYVAEADFDNEKRITKVDAPVLIFYGINDETAVPARHALVLIDLLDKAQKPHETHEVDATHSDIPEKMGSEYARVIDDFIARNVP